MIRIQKTKRQPFGLSFRFGTPSGVYAYRSAIRRSAPPCSGGLTRSLFDSPPDCLTTVTPLRVRTPDINAGITKRSTRGTPFVIGTPSGVRTLDTLIKSQVWRFASLAPLGNARKMGISILSDSDLLFN